MPLFRLPDLILFRSLEHLRRFAIVAFLAADRLNVSALDQIEPLNLCLDHPESSVENMLRNVDNLNVRRLFLRYGCNIERERFVSSCNDLLDFLINGSLYVVAPKLDP